MIASSSEVTVMIEEDISSNKINKSTQSCQEEKNLYRSSCCDSKNYIDKRMLGFLAQCTVSFSVLAFSMRQIIYSEKGDDLTIYYTLIGSIVGNFVPSYQLQKT
jgi:hypothetical protein